MKFIRLIDIIIRLFVLSLIFFSFAKYFMWTETPEVRYRKYYSRMHSMIFAQTGDIDIAAMGSSRAQTMFGAHYWAKELYGDNKDNHVVYNLSTSQRGKGFHYTVIRDLLKYRKVNKVYLHVIDSDQKKYIHPWFYLVSTHKDIWKSYRLDTGRSFHLRTQEHLQVFLKKHSSILEDKLKNRLALATSNPKKPKMAVTMDHLKANDISPKNIKLMGKNVKWNDLYTKGFEWDLDTKIEVRNTKFIHEIVKLSNENGASVDFFYVPQLYKPLMSEEMVETIEQRFGGVMMQPPKHRLREFYPAAYADAGHGSEVGRGIFAELVVDALVQRWEEENESSEK